MRFMRSFISFLVCSSFNIYCGGFAAFIYTKTDLCHTKQFWRPGCSSSTNG